MTRPAILRQFWSLQQPKLTNDLGGQEVSHAAP
jgi:hypothetical protein